MSNSNRWSRRKFLALTGAATAHVAFVWCADAGGTTAGWRAITGRPVEVFARPRRCWREGKLVCKRPARYDEDRAAGNSADTGVWRRYCCRYAVCCCAAARYGVVQAAAVCGVYQAGSCRSAVSFTTGEALSWRCVVSAGDRSSRSVEGQTRCADAGTHALENRRLSRREVDWHQHLAGGAARFRSRHGGAGEASALHPHRQPHDLRLSPRWARCLGWRGIDVEWDRGQDRVGGDESGVD